MKYYKVYEIYDNDEEYLEFISAQQNSQPKKYCVAAFESYDEAEKMVDIIDIVKCNGAEIKHEKLTPQDIRDFNSGKSQFICNNALMEIFSSKNEQEQSSN